MARRCYNRDVFADIFIRRAGVELFAALQEDGSFESKGIAEALRLADMGVTHARPRKLRCRSRNIRSTILARLGEFRRAEKDADDAVKMIDHSESPHDFVAALSSLAVVFGATGRTDEAMEILDGIEEDFPDSAPEIRARVFWCRALVYAHKRKTQGKAVRLLARARARFLRLKLQAEVVAVSAELVRLRPEGAVPQMMRELLPILDPGPIRDAVERLMKARMVDRVRLAESLRAMISGPSVLPMATLPA